MYLDNIYFGPVSEVIEFEITGSGYNMTTIAHSRKVRNTILYHTNNNGEVCYMDVVTKEIYPCSPFGLKEGEYFINTKYKLTKFSEVVDKLNEQTNKPIKIGINPSRGKILRLLKKL